MLIRKNHRGLHCIDEWFLAYAVWRGSWIYFPFDQVPVRDTVLVVNTQSEPLLLAATVRRKIFEIDSDQPVSAIRPMAQVIDDSLWQRRVLLQLIVLFPLHSYRPTCPLARR